MHHWLRLPLMCIVFSVPVSSLAAHIPPAPDSPLRAQLPLGTSFRKRCPDLQVADAGTSAVVVFWLPRGGTPSQLSIKSSSGSDALDAEAISCVSKLQFPPATTLGDAQPIDSWQQITLSWTRQGAAAETRTTTSPNRATDVARPSEPPPAIAHVRQDDAGAQASSVTVRVCVDATGRLAQDPTIVRSSGRASLDQAAVKIAAAGAAYYRPDTPSGSAPPSGCAQLAIRFDAK